MRQKLTAKEEQLMTLFWEHGDLFIRDLVALLPEPRPHYNTVATLVKFLEEKGFLEREPMANTFRYHVKVTEKQYRGETVGEMVAQYYNNSYASLVSSTAGKPWARWWPSITIIPTRAWSRSSWRRTAWTSRS